MKYLKWGRKEPRILLLFDIDNLSDFCPFHVCSTYKKLKKNKVSLLKNWITVVKTNGVLFMMKILEIA